MNVLRAREFDFCYLAIIVLSLFTGIISSIESLPYVLHPDEPVILKQPFKRIVQYAQADFSAKMNLYDISLIGWMGILYVGGYITGNWNSIKTFGEEIILESPLIILHARILSVIFITVAHCMLYKFLKKKSSLRWLSFLFILLFIFNPLLLATGFKIKFEAIVYLFTILLFTWTYRYIIEQEINLRPTLYFLLIFSMTVRIELITFVFIVIIHDAYSHYYEKKVIYTHTYITHIIYGTVIYALITLHPLVFIHNVVLEKPGMGLVTYHTFAGNIIMGFLSSISENQMIHHITQNVFFYLPVILLVHTVQIIYFILYRKSQHKYFRFLYLYLAIITIVLLIHRHSFLRYLLPLSTGILFIFSTSLLVSKRTYSFKRIWVALALLSIFSLSVEYLVFISHHKDPRILARSYILENTSREDLLAIETLSANGAYPPLVECAEQIEKKIELARIESEYGGTKYEIMRERNMLDSCRRILDICEINYLSPETHVSNDVINTKNIQHFAKLNPDYYITTQSIKALILRYPTYQNFYAYTAGNFKLNMYFPKNRKYIDPRIPLINTRRPVYIYENIYTNE